MSRGTGVVVAMGCLGLAVGVAGMARPFAGRASAAPVPKHLMKTVPEYFPTQVGTKRVYLRGDAEETQVVTKVEVKENEKIVTVEEVAKDGTKKPYQVVSVRPDGVYLVAESGSKYDTPWCVFKTPAVVGQEWETTTTRGKDWMIRGTKKVIAEERLKVPAGEIETVRVTWDSAFGAGQQRSRSVYWYAANIGVVQIDDPPHLVLKSFTAGKE
jgi:hypothetical protein